MFGRVKLRDVLAEYREKHAPHTRIELSEIDSAVGFLTAMSMPAVKDGPRTEQQKEYARAAVAMRRCRRLVSVIERYEKV